MLIYTEAGNEVGGGEAFVHGSTVGATEVVREIGEDLGLRVVDAAEFGTNQSAQPFASCESLLEYQLLVFVNSAGDDILNAAEREAMRCWALDETTPKGFVAVHGAAESLGDWDWYNGLVGASFNGHARDQDALLSLAPEAAGHPTVDGLPSQTTRFLEEWYVFRDGGGDRAIDPTPWNPRNRPGLTVVLDVDESTYLPRDYDYPKRGDEPERLFYNSELPGQPGTAGQNHPIAWFQDFEGDARYGSVRSFYTALGHGGEEASSASAPWSGYIDGFMQTHLKNAIRWASG